MKFAVGVAIACRVPLMVGPVNYDSDMVRYVWDGRAQRFGYNPYEVVPSDPALAHTHTADTVRMPSRHDRTPYPPAAQLFFRLMVTVWESARVMKARPHPPRHDHDLLRVALAARDRRGPNGW